MAYEPFPTRLRAAAIIPRWTGIWTVNKDYLAGHSFFVVFYSMMIATLIKWKPDDPSAWMQMLTGAIIHDMDELVTNDIISPVKHEILDNDKAQEFITRKMKQVVPTILGIQEGLKEKTSYYEAHTIIKAADALDALFFALMEQSMGNQVIASRLPYCGERLAVAWSKLPGDIGILEETWDRHILPALGAHADPARYDIDGGK